MEFIKYILQSGYDFTLHNVTRHNTPTSIQLLHFKLAAKKFRRIHPPQLIRLGKYQISVALNLISPTMHLMRCRS